MNSFTDEPLPSCSRGSLVAAVVRALLFSFRRGHNTVVVVLFSVA